MLYRHRIDIDIDHPGNGIGALGDLVHVADGRDAGADIEKLVDPLIEEKADGPAQEGTVGLQGEGGFREDTQDRLSGLAVDGDVMEATEEIVIHAGDTRLVRPTAPRLRTHTLPLPPTSAVGQIRTGPSSTGPDEHAATRSLLYSTEI